jgi:hypothetical protein
MQIPEGYERLNKDIPFRTGDFYCMGTIGCNDIKFWTGISGYGEESQTTPSYYPEWTFIRKIVKPLTRIEQILKIKANSKEFVTKYVPNPTKKDYKRFELTFLKELDKDNFHTNK